MLRLVLLTLVLGIVFFGAEFLGIQSWFHPDFAFMLVFFATIGLLGHWLVQRGLRNDRAQFVPFYLGSTVLRLLGALVFLFVFFRLGTPRFQLFLLNFFVLYLCYAGFEFFGVRANLRRFSE
jgi:hypothetical protein